MHCCAKFSKYSKNQALLLLFIVKKSAFQRGEVTGKAREQQSRSQERGQSQKCTHRCHWYVGVGLAKKFFQFFGKIKDTFSFSPRTLLNNIFTILFHYFLPFFRQLHNSIFSKLFIFLSKGLLLVPFTAFQGIVILFFPRREFCKDQNKWASKMQCLVNTVDESELLS